MSQKKVTSCLLSSVWPEDTVKPDAVPAKRNRPGQRTHTQGAVWGDAERVVNRPTLQHSNSGSHFVK